jgi:hypothetical protein
MQVVALCERFGWTYTEYMSQPASFIDLLMKKLEIDAKKEKQKSHR